MDEVMKAIMPDTAGMRDGFLTLAYGQYQADWMHARGYTLRDIIEGLDCENARDAYEAFAQDMDDIPAFMRMHAEDLYGLMARMDEAAGCGGKLSVAFKEWEADTGFSGELYVCRDEFEAAEFEDEGYMKSILAEEEFAAWLALR